MHFAIGGMLKIMSDAVDRASAGEARDYVIATGKQYSPLRIYHLERQCAGH